MKEKQLENSLDESVTNIFPSLTSYKAEHTLVEFKKLCLEIQTFLREVYASTRNKEEREIFFSALDKVKRM